MKQLSKSKDKYIQQTENYARIYENHLSLYKTHGMHFQIWLFLDLFRNTEKQISPVKMINNVIT